MSQKLVISIDAMGGDHAPAAIIEGVSLIAKNNPDLFFLLFGDEAQITPLTEQFKISPEQFKIHHTTDVVKADDKPSLAIRNGRESSMWKAIMAVRNGYASAVVSAGNTGALMAMSKICLGTITGIDRPAIATVLPTLNGHCVALDLGANAECNARNLVDFAIIGNAFHRVLLKKENPSIGLLNIGSEETKGRDEIKEASAILQGLGDKINFFGFIEGNDIAMGTTDIVVADGFSGNIALKTIEGTAKFVAKSLKKALTRSFFSKIGLVLALPAFKSLKKQMDPREYNGAMFLGLNGISVKSHGGADAYAFSCAVKYAVNMARGNLCERIKEDVQELLQETEQPTEE